jgi:hypothetical protein
LTTTPLLTILPPLLQARGDKYPKVDGKISLKPFPIPKTDRKEEVMALISNFSGWYDEHSCNR